MKIKILIVEDEGIVALDMANQLKGNGYEIVGIADTGIEALEMVKTTNPDIILMDIFIKGKLNGIETAHKINEFGEIPIIYITALADKKTMESAMHTFPYAYLVKPFRSIDLYSSIDLAFRNAARKASVSKTPRNEEIDIFKIHDRIFVRVDHAFFEKVQLEEIYYLEANRSYCTIICKNKVYTLSNSLNQVLQQISSEIIVRIHKSYAININYVSAMRDFQISVNNIQLPLGAGYRKQLIELFHLVR
jgi:DNA-binding LytR/AlgR family response regulator